MSYARKNIKNVTGSILGVIVVAAIAIWQFYLFVTFKSPQGGSSHLWWAMSMAVLACGAAFLIFSVFMRHDTDDDLHITSTGRSTRI
jgi:protein-S-isoprenylcysteine O-methyltransferase Ste14